MDTVKTELERGSPEYTGEGYSKKNTDLPPKCTTVAGTGSAGAESVVREGRPIIQQC